MRNSHRCQLSGSSTSSCALCSCICLWLWYLNGTSGPGRTVRPGLFTDSGRSTAAAERAPVPRCSGAQPPLTGESEPRLPPPARWFAACLQGALMSQGKSFSVFFCNAAHFSSVSVCVYRGVTTPTCDETHHTDSQVHHLYQLSVTETSLKTQKR